MLKTIYSDLQAIRSNSPLIHNVTNLVVMQQTANALLALGASPLMAHAPEEIDQIVAIANALVINIGTLDNYWIENMQQAMSAAQQRKIPIVLDPVGVGVSSLRTQTARNLLQSYKPDVIRGNASEILALVTDLQTTKGVDSAHSSSAAINAAQQLSQQFKCVVVVSGAVDYVVNSQQQIGIKNGVALMTRVTGMGCTATALIAAFCAVNQNYYQAAAHAMAVMGIAGEIAYELAQGPGTFQQYFFDALYQLSLKDIEQRLKIIECHASQGVQCAPRSGI